MSKLTERSEADFLASRRDELQDAVRNIKTAHTIVQNLRGDEAERLGNDWEADPSDPLATYDKYVVGKIMDWIFGSAPADVREIAKVAVANEERTGTEPQMTIYAIEEALEYVKKWVKNKTGTPRRESTQRVPTLTAFKEARGDWEGEDGDLAMGVDEGEDLPDEDEDYEAPMCCPECGCDLDSLEFTDCATCGFDPEMDIEGNGFDDEYDDDLTADPDFDSMSDEDLEAEEERLGIDLDSDNEEGESPRHRRQVLGEGRLEQDALDAKRDAKRDAAANNSAAQKVIDAFPGEISNEDAPKALQMYLDLLAKQPNGSKVAAEVERLKNSPAGRNGRRVLSLLWHHRMSVGGDKVITTSNYRRNEGVDGISQRTIDDLYEAFEAEADADFDGDVSEFYLMLEDRFGADNVSVAGYDHKQARAADKWKAIMEGQGWMVFTDPSLEGTDSLGWIAIKPAFFRA